MTQVEKKKFKRLSRCVIPLHYDITLQPDLEKFVFSGKETIDVTVVKETKQIKLNCLDIDISSATYTTEDGIVLTPKDIKYNEQSETVKFKFENALLTGKGRLSIEFTGILNDKLKGFYRTNQGGAENKQYAAVTHFEPTDARRAFPCWDEPALKCTFDITLVVPEDKVALSNMNVVETGVHSDNASLKVVKFATTPKMSTYIIAFIVGDFDHVESTTDSGVLVRVYTSAGKANQGRFALEVATRTLMFYEDYFGIPYGLPKIDLIGVADFPIGAMENWGLVTYREQYLLVAEGATASSTKQFVAEIIGHELAHNWFGNLVTMEWWTHLWLKEGFANFIEYLCVDHLYPEYDIWSQFVTSQNIVAQTLDALSNSHPIEVAVGHPSEVEEIFDQISYSKGASVLRMLHQYIGAEDFKSGLHSYLEKYQFQNTKTEDLWEQLEIVSKKPVERVMSTWTQQLGFPVVSVSRETIGDGKEVLKISQSKFSIGDQNGKKFRWMIPINICTGKSPDDVAMTVLMSDPDMLIYVDKATPEDWIKLNPGQTDYYRVKYSEEMLKQLIPAIKSKQLSSRDRLGVQNDLFAMACAGYSPTVEYIHLLNAYIDEDDYTVWTDILSNLKKLLLLFERTNSFDQFKSFVLTLITPISERIGYQKKEDEGQLISMLRNSVYTLLGMLGHKHTVQKFTEMFDEHVREVSVIDTDLRHAVYATVCCHGDADTLKHMKELVKKTDVADERSRLLRNMGRFDCDQLRNDVLQFSISEEVRNQDTLATLSGCLSRHAGQLQTWKFIKENWDVYQVRCAGGHARANLINYTIQNFATTEELKNAEEFLNAHPVPSAERTIKQAMETIKNNIEWLERLSGVCAVF
ncbi:puromycin-sensitive aminopeptidase-like [Hydractinia symbiolongicarpus]|uniref:puromycin-sensitive aminopeptidase-like n=1 Tax=Hydractinia symbiolongicarpus TaxID=13093 RepID=UPI00254FFEE4|nr:puromycin-sensitive aminopeptidase-like [Hydractinia symbiolongicarpus]